MNNGIFKKAKWIRPCEFAGLSPIDVFHREKEMVSIDLPEELKNLHFFMKKEFEAEKVGRTTLKITADDYYKLYINGRFVGQGSEMEHQPLSPLGKRANTRFGRGYPAEDGGGRQTYLLDTEKP